MKKLSTRSYSTSKIPKKINKTKSNTIKSEPSKPDQEALLKNIEYIDKLINNSQQIVEQQDFLLNKFSKINITEDDLELNNNEDFMKHIEKYSKNLNIILSKIKIQNEQNDEIKCKIINELVLKEENALMKKKIEIFEKKDDNLFKASISNQFNNFNKFLNNLNISSISHSIKYILI
jgi:hypothetical protein